MHKKQQYKVLVTKYAFYSKVGHMPNNPNKQNQDSFLVNPKILGSYSQHLFGVADGHGQYGKEVSTIVKQKYPGTYNPQVNSNSVPGRKSQIDEHNRSPRQVFLPIEQRSRGTRSRH